MRRQYADRLAIVTAVIIILLALLFAYLRVS